MYVRVAKKLRMEKYSKTNYCPFMSSTKNVALAFRATDLRNKSDLPLLQEHLS